MRHILAAAVIVLALATAAAPAGAHGSHSATVEVSGACNPQDDGASDSASVTVTDHPDASVSQPDEGNVEAALASCAEDAAAGQQPGPGSHLTVTVYQDGEEAASAGTGDLPLP